MHRSATGRLQHHLAGWTLTKSKWNVHVYLDIYDHSPTQTNNKSQSFSSDIQIKTKRPSGGRNIGVLCAYDSFITGL